MNHKDQGGGVAATWAVHQRPREGARTTGFDGGGGTKANEEAWRNGLASRWTEEETRGKSKALPGSVEECGAPGESGAVVKKVLGTGTTKPGVMWSDLNIAIAALIEAKSLDRACGSF